MTTFFSSSPLSPPPPAFFTDEGMIFIPATANGTTSERSSSPSSLFPSFLDPFNIFTPPPLPSIPEQSSTPPPQPSSNSPLQRSPPSPGSAVLLLAGFVGGASVVASTSTFFLLRRSLARSTAQKIAQGTDKSLDEIRSALSTIEEKLGGLEGRISAGSGAGGGGKENGGLLKDLRKRRKGLKKEGEKMSLEQEWDQALEAGVENGEVRSAGINASDLRARSPFDFVPPSQSTLPTSFVEAPTGVASSPLSPPPPTTEPFADKLIELVRNQQLDVLTAPQVSDQVRLALENKQSKLEAQSARKWKQAFEKEQPTPPPLVRVKDADKVWEKAFQSKEVDVASSSIEGEPARETSPEVAVESEPEISDPASTSSSSSSDPVEIAQEEKLSSSSDATSSNEVVPLPSPDRPSDSSIPPASTPTQPDFHEPLLAPSHTSPSPLDPPPPTESSTPPTTTLGKDLDLAASLASRIDSHWYSGTTQSSQETSNTRAEPQAEKTSVVVEKEKSRQTRSRSPANSAANTSSTSFPPPPRPRNATTPSSSWASSEPTQQHQHQPKTKASFHFGAATLLFPPGLGFAGVYSYPPLPLRNESFSSPPASNESEEGAGSEKKKEEVKLGRGRGSVVDEVVKGYDRDGVLRSFRRRFL